MTVTRTRKALLSIGAAGALLGVAVAIQPLVRGDRVEHPGVITMCPL